MDKVLYRDPTPPIGSNLLLVIPLLQKRRNQRVWKHLSKDPRDDGALNPNSTTGREQTRPSASWVPRSVVDYYPYDCILYPSQSFCTLREGHVPGFQSTRVTSSGHTPCEKNSIFLLLCGCCFCRYAGVGGKKNSAIYELAIQWRNGI
jgi:hypothetical protein